jgi:hypothetical protein
MAVNFGIAEIEHYTAQARTNKEKGYAKFARNAMRKAQNVWEKGLGIPMPDFTHDEWIEIDIAEIEQYKAQARMKKEKGFTKNARKAMRKAQIVWKEGLGIPMPDFTHDEWIELDIAEIEQYTAQARMKKEEGYARFARKAMGSAQKVWKEGLGIPMPDFTHDEWIELDVAEIAQYTALARNNATAGSESGMLAALRAAYEIWETLPETQRRGFDLEEERNQLYETFRERGPAPGSLPQHLKRLSTQSPFECAICLDTVEQGQLHDEHTKCGHQFCVPCMDAWAERADTCPWCRIGL